MKSLHTVVTILPFITVAGQRDSWARLSANLSVRPLFKKGAAAKPTPGKSILKGHGSKTHYNLNKLWNSKLAKLHHQLFFRKKTKQFTANWAAKLSAILFLRQSVCSKSIWKGHCSKNLIHLKLTLVWTKYNVTKYLLHASIHSMKR